MRSIGIVAVRDFLRNVATEEELESLEEDIAFRRDALAEQTTRGELTWEFFGDGHFMLVSRKGTPHPGFNQALENFKRQHCLTKA